MVSLLRSSHRRNMFTALEVAELELYIARTWITLRRTQAGNGK
jgi:hypothetical protein